MKIAIIGSNSFLGRNIFKLARENNDVVLLGKEHYHPPYLSFNNNFNWSLILKSDLIIHCVSTGVQRNSSISHSSAMEVNYDEPIRLLLKLHKDGFIGRVLTFGSYSEIGINLPKIHYSEEALVAHQNNIFGAYAESKYKLTSHISKHPYSLRHFHFIIPNLYGAGENKDRLFPYIKRNIFHNRKLEFSEATQIRQFVHVSDVANICMHIPKNISNGIFNLGTQPVSVKDAIHLAIATFEQQLSKKAFYEFGAFSAPNSLSPYWILDDTKARTMLGWAPAISLNEGLLEY